MARNGPDTATTEFFICVGDQPELDFGGRRNPDGQGFAAFGRVITGMDIVSRIHQQAADKQRLTPLVPIRAIRRAPRLARRAIRSLEGAAAALTSARVLSGAARGSRVPPGAARRAAGVRSHLESCRPCAGTTHANGPTHPAVRSCRSRWPAWPAPPRSRCHAPSPRSRSPRVAGANRRVRVGLIGCGGMGTSDLRDSRSRLGAQVRRALRRRRRAEREGRRTWSAATSRQTPELVTPRLPPRPRSQRHRCRSHLDPRPLARAAYGDGLPGRQGCLLREAALDEHQRRPDDGRGRAQIQPHRPDGHATAQRDWFRGRIDYVKSGQLGKDPAR